MRDDDVRKALELHVVPAQSPTFFDDLWERVQEREHAAAVRWRRISAALAIVAVAAIGTATVFAAPHGSNTVDETVTCTLQQQGGIPVVNVLLRTKSPPSGAPPYTYTYPAVVDVSTGVGALGPSGVVNSSSRFFTAQGGTKGYLLNGSACRSGGARPALDGTGLVPTRPLHRGYLGIAIRCLGPARVTMRVRLTQNGRGEPTRVLVAGRIARTGKPLFYVDWTQTSIRAAAARSCDVESA